MKIMMLGAPGAGKGTLAGLVYKKYMIPQISTGDLLREATKNQTELGLTAQKYMDRGELVPDDLVLNLLQQRIAKADCNKGFILDGFPRNVPQAEALEKLGIAVDKVLNFIVPEKIILERLTGRRTCKDCGAIFHIKNIPPKVEGVCDKCGGKLYQREDQKEDVIKERLRVYKEQTEPLIDFYKNKDLLADIDASTDPDTIFKEIDKVLEKIKE